MQFKYKILAVLFLVFSNQKSIAALSSDVQAKKSSSETEDVFVAVEVCKLLNDVDTCCAQLQSDFQDTWTIIQSFIDIIIPTDISSVYTAFNSLTNQIDVCCAQQEQNFVDTWTILNAVTYTQNITFTTLLYFYQCRPTPITEPIIIDTPGSYCLQATLSVGGGTPIIINANNVTLDLNGHFVSGSTGILVSDDVENVLIRNGEVRDTTDVGIQIGLNASAISIENIQLQGCASVGISFEGQNSGCVVKDVLIANSQGTAFAIADSLSIQIKGLTIDTCQAVGGNSIGIDISGSSKNLFFSDIKISNCSADGGESSGIRATGVSTSFFDGVMITDISTTNTGDAFGVHFNTSSATVRGSSINNIQAALNGISTAQGIYFISSEVDVFDSSISNIDGPNAYGIHCALSQRCNVIRSLIANIRSTVPTGSIGISFETTSDSVIDASIVQAVTYRGISVDGENVVRNSATHYCGDSGLQINNALTFVQNCQATGCVGAGIVDVVSTNTIIDCYASGNTPNYTGISDTYAVGSATLAGFNVSA